MTATDTATGCQQQLTPVTIEPVVMPGQTTLVNQLSIDTSAGNPSCTYNFMNGTLDASGNLILVGNTQTNKGIKLLINKYLRNT